MARFDCNRLNEIANSLLGVPYKVGGRDVHGIDCFGLVLLFFRELGIYVRYPNFVYAENWHKDKNYIEENTDGFDLVDSPDSGDILLMCIGDSVVCNHLALCLSSRDVLNVDRYAGVHRIRYYLVREYVKQIRRLRP